MAISFSNAQNKDIKIGESELIKTGVNYYNYSDLKKVNFEIMLMGGVRNPGKYLIPQGTTLIELLSLSGPPLDAEIYSNIKFIRIVQNKGIATTKTTILDYSKLFEKDGNGSQIKTNPILSPGDLIVMQIKPDKTFFEYVKDVLVIVTPLITLTTLIVTISKK